MEKITSKDNKRLKTLQKLFCDRALRYEAGLFPTEGVRLTAEALRLGLRLDSLYVTESAVRRVYSEISILIENAGEVFKLPDHLADKLGDTRSPQGVAGVFEMPPRTEPPLGGSALMLCHIQDPGNVGALLRSAAAFGVKAVLSSDCPDPYSPKVLRASMGGVLGGNWSTVQSPLDYIASWRAVGGVVYASSLRAGATSLFKAAPCGALVLLGNEGAGLPDSYIGAADGSLYIPIGDGAESLNVAVAGGIIAYEMARGLACDT